MVVVISAQVGITLLSMQEAPTKPMTVKPVAILINNDDSQRHVDNILAAKNACTQFGIEPIIISSDEHGKPTRKKVIQTLEQVQDNQQPLALIYLTGHGLLLFNGSEKPSSSIHFKDGPLVANDIASRLGSGPIAIYIDVCFAPGWVEELNQAMPGPFLLLSDKPVNAQQRSCRGVSTEFWRLVGENQSVPFTTSLSQAWESVCPDGVRIGHCMSEAACR
ncbi:MAG: hypothetical protein P9L94_16025 [Candidatus Hinthialibacter antarcticus]|nr:hypothetical protein [Candidatus Hinthialibacter antarcticus]